MRLIWSMADTTWRMFTPPVLLVPGGIWADLKFHTKPWLTILSTVMGLALAILLVKKQLGKNA
jgi:F0F1-type ATP synthase assembly protein I